MSYRLVLWIIGVYLGILLMILATDVMAADLRKQISVMIIDTGVEKDHQVFNGKAFECSTTKDCYDINGHGTAVASLILHGELDEHNMPTSEICKSVKVISCNYFTNRTGEIDCLKQALKNPPTFINFSSVGYNEEKLETALIMELSKFDTKLITAMGNDGGNVKDLSVYPALLSTRTELRNTVIPVAGLTRGGSRWDRSNYGIPSMNELATKVRTAYMGRKYVELDGTSMSAALYTNKLLRQECDKQK